jgi:hypothetical protein
MVCYRFRDCLGSESIVVHMAGRAAYSHPDLNVKENRRDLRDTFGLTFCDFPMRIT